jgi:sulfite exporter TauE/SafE
MNALLLLPVFVVGLAGSVHCAGMCGGIVGALSVIPAQAAIHRTPARKISMDSRVRGGPSMRNDVLHVLAYNAGRIASYMIAGALAGGLAGGARNLAPMIGMQSVFYWLANLMLIALGLYLMNAWHGLSVLEQGGRVVWQRAQPIIAPALKTLMPADQPHKAFAMGALWGWLPCGMVYSALATAMLSGSATDGAAVMLAFGLGTLPMLTGLGLMGARVQQAMRKRHVRIACGLLVLAFGVIGLARAAGGITPDWINMLCLTPHS